MTNIDDRQAISCSTCTIRRLIEKIHCVSKNVVLLQ